MSDRSGYVAQTRARPPRLKPSDPDDSVPLPTTSSREDMGFFLQLRLLLWKNFVIRKRNKLRCVLEVVWPLFLFLILMWVRTRGLKETRPECHYLEKAMPSSGQLAFLHSVICNSLNKCHHKEVSPDYSPGSNASKFAETVQATGVVLKREGIVRRLGNSIDTLADLITNFTNNQSSVPESIPLRELLSREFGKNLTDAQLQVRLSPQEVDRAVEGINPRPDPCEDLPICSVPDSVWSLFTTQGQQYRIYDMDEIMHGWEWVRFNALLQDVGTDMDRLAENNIDPRLMSALSLLSMLSPNQTAGNRNETKPPMEAQGWCDTLDYWNDPINMPETDIQRMMRGDMPHIKGRYQADENEPESCKKIFNGTNPAMAVIWRVLKPFFTGKILYTPNTTATRTLMKSVNTTFNQILSLPGEDALTLPPPRTATSVATIQEFVRSPAGRRVMRASLAINGDLLEKIARPRALTDDLRQLGEQGRLSGQDWGQLTVDLLKLIQNFVECINRDKVVPVDKIEDAEEMALQLVPTNNLWALVVFDHVGTDEVFTFIKYRIRMSANRVDGTTEIFDKRTNLRSRDEPLFDLKYLTYGFAFLQDMLDSAILQHHTNLNNTEIPGRILQQFPYPEYIMDTFIRAISHTFPMFMVMAWVYTSSMLVKSIVYEKEQRIKETLNVMGLSNAVHWMGWFIDSFVAMFISAILLSSILVYGKVVENSSYGVVLLFLISYCCATISQSFLISVFFSKANVAAAAGGIIFFITYNPYPLILRFIDLIPYEGIVAVSLLSNIAFGLGASVFASYEQLGVGVNWSNWNVPAAPEDVHSLATCITMLWVDAIVYGIFTWYIEAVFPGEYGVPKPFYFFLQKSYWTGQSEIKHTSPTVTSSTEASNLEAEPRGTVGVSLEGLSKEFAGKPAVSDLTINFYENQITSFLGHNGAGKTTTISMLTGMYPPTRGTAYIYGLDIRTQMDSIRSSLGVCPQHNVLYDSLTVAEHLWFFGRIKGQEKTALATEIERMLKDMTLTDKRDALTGSLSGGMKRKLSVSMAYIGGSRTVILDEPTAGVDPYSRRAIWDLLIKYRPGRTILLTTHFMDEADLLGDRIAIISNGRLKCCGSSLFLKSRFGSGYYLTIEWKQKPVDTEQDQKRLKRIQSLVAQSVPDSEMVLAQGLEVLFLIRNREDVEAITKVLNQLEEHKNEIGIDSYGISDTSLEEIFLKVASDDDKTPKETIEKSVAMNGLILHYLALSVGDTAAQENKCENVVEGWSLLWQQFYALTLKRLHYTRRDLKGIFTQLILPALFVAVGLAFTTFYRIAVIQPELELEPRLFGSPYVAFLEKRDHGSMAPDYYKSILKDGISSTLVPERENMSHPDLSPLIRMSRNKGNGICVLDNTPHFSIPSGEYFYNVTGENVPQWLIDSHMECRRNRHGGISVGAVYPWTDGVNLSLPGFDPKEDNVKIWYNNKGHPSSVAYQNAMNNVLLRASLPKEKQKDARNYGILTSNHPLPLTSDQYKDKARSESSVVVFIAVAVIFAMSFVPASFVMFLIEDRVGQSKHLQLMAGMKRSVYWVQAYIWDMVCFCLSGLLVVLIFLAFDVPMFTTGRNMLALIVLIVLYGWASIPMQYLFSWLFRIASMAFVSLSCGNLFIGLTTTLTVMVLGQFMEDDLANTKEVLEEVFLIFPQYCLGQGLMNMAMQYSTQQVFKMQGIIVDRNVFDWSVTGKHLLCMFLIGIICFALVFLVEYGNQLFRFGGIETNNEVPEENDVAQEHKRVLDGQAESDILVLDRLTKRYKKGSPLAVNQVTFGVHKAECFGLLGLNGAGKTSIFKMLTGDTTVSGGDARILGFSVKTDMDAVRRRVGYCPQFDALVSLLTVREHLELYARLKGITSMERQACVDRAIMRLNLGFHQEKLAKSLSGGNKRKLSTAIALVGNPGLIYLDEPTTSMDPGARRFLWDCVNSVVASGCSVVLTSHSMEECQALCSRLTIMVNGQLKCIGSPQHLKAKYGNGYSVVIRCAPGALSEVQTLVRERLPDSQAAEEHLNQLKYHIPPSSSLVDIFHAMDSARKADLLIDYSISQTTLEDVFLQFAQLQLTEGDAPPEQQRRSTRITENGQPAMANGNGAPVGQNSMIPMDHQETTSTP